MGQIVIGEAIGEGFGLIARRPVTILAWGLARTVVVGGYFAAVAPFYLTILYQAAKRAAGDVTTPPDLTQMMSLQGLMWLMSLVTQFVGAVLYCAALRAVMFPEQRSYAYLRIGAAELFLFLLIFGGSFAAGIGLVIVALPVIIVAAIAFGVHAIAVGVVVAVVGGLAVLALLIWILCRLSLVAPMMVEDGKFHLTDAWALTSGQFWPLFAIGALLFVILLVIEAVVGVVVLALGFGYISQLAGGSEGLKTFFTRPPAEIMASLGPVLLVALVVSIPLYGALNAILMAPWARAYRDLRPPTDVAATFA